MDYRKKVGRYDFVITYKDVLDGKEKIKKCTHDNLCSNMNTLDIAGHTITEVDEIKLLSAWFYAVNCFYDRYGRRFRGAR